MGIGLIIQEERGLLLSRLEVRGPGNLHDVSGMLMSMSLGTNHLQVPVNLEHMLLGPGISGACIESFLLHKDMGYKRLGAVLLLSYTLNCPSQNLASDHLSLGKQQT